MRLRRRDLDAEGLAEDDEADPGLTIGVDSDDQDGDGTPDWQENQLPATAEIFKDLVALTVQQVKDAAKVTEGEVTLAVHAASAENGFGGVRLLKKDGSSLSTAPPRPADDSP